MNHKEAIAAGAPRYAMTKPCKHGHLAERYTSCGKCVQCDKDRQMQWTIKVQAGRRAAPQADFSRRVDVRHHATLDALLSVLTRGRPDQVELCAAVINMIRDQIEAKR